MATENDVGKWFALTIMSLLATGFSICLGGPCVLSAVLIFSYIVAFSKILINFAIETV